MKPICTEKYNWYKWQEDCEPLEDDYDTGMEPDYEELFTGDVVLLLKGNNPCQITEIPNPKSHSMRVKILGLSRTRHRIITRWDIRKRDEFLTAVYKANASAR